MFLRFQAKQCFSLFYARFKILSNFRGRAYIIDVIVMPYEDIWYSFWYQWKEETHSYTLRLVYKIYSVSKENGFRYFILKESHTNPYCVFESLP